MPTGFTTPLVHSPKEGKANFAYRNGLGIATSAEFDVFHEDFHTFMVATAITNGPVANTPLGNWAGAIIDTGATVVANTTATLGANGVITFADATASEGAAIYTTKSFQLVAGKKFFCEARIRTDDVTDNAIQFGLSDQTAVVNPEDLYNTTSANLVAFGLLDGSAFPQMLSDKSNSGTAVQTQTEKLLVANTWHILGIGYDGDKLTGWVDGKKVLTWSSANTTIPTATALGLFISHVNGDGAGAAVVLCDYIRAISER
jgi:hypothetical protein